MQNVVIIGTGYVGLVSGVCLAARGHKVICIDTDLNIINSIRAGVPHIYEKSLSEILINVLKSGNFTISNDLSFAIKDADGVIIAVGTPSINGKLDLTQVHEAAKAVGAELRYTKKVISVIVKSTVLPGSTDKQVKKALELESGKKHGDFGLGMNPEFLREGNAVGDFMDPDRIVIGCEDQYAKSFLEALYAPWSCDKLIVNSRTAELIKYANNSLLATQISAVNEFANIASAIGGIDIMDVVSGLKLDKRWNPIIDGKRINPEILDYLTPGCGYGGSCFPKDVSALRTFASDLRVPTNILDGTIKTNDHQPSQVIRILKQAVGNLQNKIILVLGLAFKPGTDDIREAPSIKIVSELSKDGPIIQVHDPKALSKFKNAKLWKKNSILFVNDWSKKIESADIIIILTPWDEYRKLINHDVSDKVVFDARRNFSPEELVGANYIAIGKSKKILHGHLDEEGNKL